MNGFRTHLERRLLAVHDAKLRRCWFCGEWAYDVRDCTACTAPSERPRSESTGRAS